MAHFLWSKKIFILITNHWDTAKRGTYIKSPSYDELKKLYFDNKKDQTKQV
jgi:hypothetical protein